MGLSRKSIFIVLLFLGLPSVAMAESVSFMVLGVIASDRPEEGVALLKFKSDNRVKAIKSGATIDGTTTLSLVERKYVEVQIKDKPYRIRVGSDVPRTFSPAAPADIGPISTTDGVERAGNEFRVNAALKENLVGENLGKVLMQAASEPYVENGIVRGFRLWDIEQGSIYQHAGFVNGDLITHINGMPLNDAGNAIKTLNSLRKATVAEVTFKRGGIEQNLTIRVQ